MNTHQLRIYFEELDKHACWALEAYDRIQQNPDANAINLFSSAHQMLGHAGVVSRLIWPEDMVVPRENRRLAQRRHKRALERGENLRSRLVVDLISPLNRPELRRHVASFEENLDTWVNDDLDQIVLPQNSEDNLKGRRIGPVAEDVLRHFNIRSGEFDFRGTVFPLQAIAEALTDLRLRIDLTLDKDLSTV
ncbi:MAG: hypothetical protein V2A56_07865 [bacterium]